MCLKVKCCATMDTPAHIRDCQNLLKETYLLNYRSIFLNLKDKQSVRLYQETHDDIQSRLDHLRAIALLRSIPELVQTPSPARAPRQSLGRTARPGTQEESPFLTPGQLSHLESPQSDLYKRCTEACLPFRDTIAAIQLSLDRIRANTLLRGILLLIQGKPQVDVPTQPCSLPSTDTPEKTPSYPSPVAQDEETQQRGCKRLRVTWFPDTDMKRITFESANRTPSNITSGLPPQKANINLRSVPHKRMRFS